MSDTARPRVAFVTGKLAAPALTKLVAELGPRAGFEPVVVTQKISVAALMNAGWLVGKLRAPEGVRRIVLPGGCTGDLAPLQASLPADVTVEKGPFDFRDLPEYFRQAGRDAELADAGFEILAEINHANRLAADELLREAEALRAAGAHVVDLGATPSEPWTTVREAVRRLVDAGFRVSIDSFDRTEVEEAVRGGAALVLSVNATNRDAARDWGVEVVVLPDRTDDEAACVDALGETLAVLGNTPVRLDPILEPIGFGFARSLGRYLAVRRAFPNREMLMGVGNLTELTEVDSAGVNALLAGFCAEQRIGSVLTTQVANWARSSVAELAIARRMMHAAVTQNRLPKKMGGKLAMLRDPKLRPTSEDDLRTWQAELRDRNYRLFAEAGDIVAFNAERFERDADPFALFARLGVDDPSHAFYLGWEAAKAALALHLGKRYVQDQALSWGLLTKREPTRHEREELKRSEPE